MSTQTRMLTYYSPDHALHAPPGEILHGHRVPYFEMPERAERIRASLESANLITIANTPPLLPLSTVSRVHTANMTAYFEWLSANATALIHKDLETYNLAHLLTGTEYYYQSVFESPTTWSQRKDMNAPGRRSCFIYDSTSPVGSGTWQAVLASAALAYHGAQALLNGEPQAYALCRPPGHHAGPDFVGGYCYLNNAALAADALLAKGKVAILDVDYHHGNGTQAIFWENPHVCFVSIHADPAADYPHYSGFREEAGAGAGIGTTHNLPLPHGTGETAYMKALDEALVIIERFRPASLVVSLGFDTYEDDPMGAFKLELQSYSTMGQRIAASAAQRYPVLYVQEGGYCLERLGDMAVAFFRGVLNR